MSDTANDRSRKTRHGRRAVGAVLVSAGIACGVVFRLSHPATSGGGSTRTPHRTPAFPTVPMPTVTVRSEA